MSRPLTDSFIRQVPKTDLHVHLDGSLRLGSLIEMARAEGVELPSYEEAGLRELVFKDHYADLPEYLHGFAYTCAVLRTAENLERVAYELAWDNINEGVRYVEARFAPQLHVHPGLEIKEVVTAVARGMERAQKEFNARPEVAAGDDLDFHFGLIACAMRRFSAGMSSYYAGLLGSLSHMPKRQLYGVASLELARAAVELRDREGLPVVGFDLAGEEAGYPAGDHAPAYHYAHSHFLRKTVHAGEAYGPESIFHAITECHTNRVGHGTFLFCADTIMDPGIEDRTRYVERLAEYVASQRVTLEVCLTSNLQTTPSIGSIAVHPIREMIERKLSVSICTDNRLVSNTTVTDELRKLVAAIPISSHEFRDLIVAGFKGSFFPGTYREKRAFVRRLLRRYAVLEGDPEGCVLLD